jgi:hypothetical protein
MAAAASAIAAVVGAAVAVIGATTSAATAGSASAKAKKAAREADRVAKKKVEEAKKELQRMPMQELALDLQGFQAEQEASQVTAAGVLQAGQEGDRRGLAAVAGRTQMADIEQQRKARIDKAADLQTLEQLKAKERQEASDKLYDLNLAEAEGAQVAAAEAEQMSEAYKGQAIQSGLQAVQGAANLAGAATQSSTNASTAFDKHIAGGGEQNIKQFMLNNPDAVAKYGTMGIESMSLSDGSLKKGFLGAYPSYQSYADYKFQKSMFGDLYEANLQSDLTTGK